MAHFLRKNESKKFRYDSILSETQMKNCVENQTDMKDIFQEMTYDELKEILKNWLNPSDDTQEESVGIEEDTT